MRSKFMIDILKSNFKIIALTEVKRWLIFSKKLRNDRERIKDIRFFVREIENVIDDYSIVTVYNSSNIKSRVCDIFVF